MHLRFQKRYCCRSVATGILRGGLPMFQVVGFFIRLIPDLEFSARVGPRARVEVPIQSFCQQTAPARHLDKKNHCLVYRRTAKRKPCPDHQLKSALVVARPSRFAQAQFCIDQFAFQVILTVRAHPKTRKFSFTRRTSSSLLAKYAAVTAFLKLKKLRSRMVF